jgi:hypothetical protein
MRNTLKNYQTKLPISIRTIPVQFIMLAFMRTVIIFALYISDPLSEQKYSSLTLLQLFELSAWAGWCRRLTGSPPALRVADCNSPSHQAVEDVAAGGGRGCARVLRPNLNVVWL